MCWPLPVRRCHDGGVGVGAGEVVGEGDAVLDGVAALLAVDADHAGEGLAQQVEAGALGVGAGLAEGADGAVDELRVELLHGLIAEAQPVHDAGAEALDEDVGVLYELLADLDGARVLEVHDDGFLAAVDPGVGHALAVHEGGVGAGRVAALGLDLDDVGAEVGGHRAGAGAGNVRGEVNDLYIVEHHFHI